MAYAEAILSPVQQGNDDIILHKTGGNTSKVEKLVLRCALMAISTGKECIELAPLGLPKWTKDSFGTREITL